MKKLLSFFGFVKKQQDINDNNNVLQFIIDSDGIPNIKVSISNTNSKDADFFANFMHHLMIGSYNQSILDILDSISKEDNHIKQFINKVLIYYNLYQTDFILDNTNNKNKISRPLVRPTEFNKKIYE